MKQVTWQIFALFVTCAPLSLSQPSTTHSAHLRGWYPTEKKALTSTIQDFFSYTKTFFSVPIDKKNVRALFVPHAGYQYSGLCAAAAFACLQNAPFKRAIILAPSHSTPFSGIALPSYKKYKTPLGILKVRNSAIKKLSRSNLFSYQKNVHETEHSLELQLPFIQACLNKPTIIPLIVGNLNEENLVRAAEAIAPFWDEKTILVVTSDLTHFGAQYGFVPFSSNIAFNLATLNNAIIESLTSGTRKELEAAVKSAKTICGHEPLRLLMELLNVKKESLTSWLACSYASPAINSGKTPPSPQELLRVIPDENIKNSVGYASIVWSKPSADNLLFKDQITGFEQQVLLKIARNAIEQRLLTNHLPFPFAKTPGLLIPAGSFATLYKQPRELRGCIGRIITKDPLYKTVFEMALAAAFQDSRFKPLAKEELQTIFIDVSILEQPWKVASYEDIKLHEQGIALSKKDHSALFLPKVATEFGWNLITTLEQLSEKAGLSKNGWKDAELSVFSAINFEESH